MSDFVGTVFLGGDSEGVAVGITYIDNGVTLEIKDREGNPLCDFDAESDDFQALVETLNAAYEDYIRRKTDAQYQAIAAELEALEALEAMVGTEICPICFSDNIQNMRWVNKAGEVVDECGDGSWCIDCDQAARDQHGGTGTLGYQRPIYVEDLTAANKYLKLRRAGKLG